MVDHGGSTPGLLALAVRVVGIAGRLVPAALRSDWEREWHAELWHLSRSLDGRGRPSVRDRAAFLLRSVGSVFDAMQLRLGDAQSWRESFSAVMARWGEHTRSVAAALLVLSVGIAADALLLAFGYLVVEDPRSPWTSLTSVAQLQLLGVAVACGVSMIVASAVAAAQLLGTASPPPRGHGTAGVAETVLVAGVTGWVGHWLAAMGTRTAAAPRPGGWLASADVDAAVTGAWLVSWLCGLAALTALGARRRARTAGPLG